jgi:trimeric autotransporter adhesin
MKKLLCTLFTVIGLLLIVFTAYPQGLVISPNESAIPDPSAMLDVQSSEKGFLPPRMTTSERNNIVSPANGLVVYDTNEESLFLFSGTEWEPLATGPGSRWEANGVDIYRNSGNVGIGTNNPDYPLHVETDGEFTIYGTNLNASATSYTVVGINHSTSGRGVYGYSNASTGNTVGVYAVSASNSGRGLVGWASASEGTTYGVYGLTYSTSGRGVYGHATATTGATYGVYGMNSSTSGYGVTGHASASSGANYGVYGSSSSTSGHGVYGMAAASSGITHGVYGFVSSPDGYAGFFTGITGSKNYFHQSVGIGALNPNEKLEVVGNIHVSGGNRTIFNRSNNSLAFGTNNTERMRITSDGSVGIGTTNPSDRLTITSTEDESALRVVVGTTTRLRVYSSGGVGIGSNMVSNPPPAGYLAVSQGISIGTTDPSIYQLRLSSDLAAKPTSSSWTIFSDARLKKNIQTIEKPLERMLALRGVTYQWIDPASQGDMDGIYTGMIAQEVETVFPEWIREDAEGYKTLTVIGFEGIVVEALRELREEKDAQIKNLKEEKDREIEALKVETRKLETVSERLQNEKDHEIARLSARLQILESGLTQLLKQQEIAYSQAE